MYIYTPPKPMRLYLIHANIVLTCVDYAVIVKRSCYTNFSLPDIPVTVVRFCPFCSPHQAWFSRTSPGSICASPARSRSLSELRAT